MTDWLDGLVAATGRGEAVALVTVAATRGSTPRESGAKMAVGGAEIWDTIGGGQLEHAAIESGRLLLEEGGNDYANSVERHVLSPRQGQCCGGVADLLIERIPGGRHEWLDRLTGARRARRPVLAATSIHGNDVGKRVIDHPAELSGGSLQRARLLAERALAAESPVYDRQAGWLIESVAPSDLQIVLFGAGHVGRALAGVLATLPCELHWVDSRSDQFPGALPGNVRAEAVREPETIVDGCAPGDFYLVMTHSHPLDFAICERVLERGDFAYCGLIGSAAKRVNLEKRLKLKGVTESALNRLTCPIGVDGISGKRPEEIAVSVAAEVLAVRDSIRARHRLDPPGASEERYGTCIEGP